MNIAKLSMETSLNNIKSDFGVKMLDKTMENSEKLAEQQVKMLSEADVNGVGKTFDVRI